MATGSAPRVGAIAQRHNHVAYVTGVNGDGTINISDMNYRSLYAVTYRTVPANQWLFIY
jgi:surface antigen